MNKAKRKMRPKKLNANINKKEVLTTKEKPN